MNGNAIRSVSRALAVMRALQQLQAASLAELQAACALPKPTLLRLLRTLEAEQAVWRSAGDGLWRPAFDLRPTRILKPAHQRLIAAAQAPMNALRRKVIWPSDLAVRDGNTMLLLETTRLASGLAVNRDEIGHRIDILRSAVGQAWMAAADANVIDKLAHALARRMKVDAQVIKERMNVSAAKVRRLGYAERAQGFGGRDDPIDRFDDQLAAIAVPVSDGKQALGAINIVWLKRFDPPAALLKRHLEHLQEAADQIAAQWHAQAGRRH